MPKLVNQVPKLRKNVVGKKAYAVVTLSGRTHSLGPYGSESAKSEYERLVGEWLARGRQSLASSESTAIKVSQLIARYWTFAKTYYIKNGKPTDELASIKVALRDCKKLYAKTHVDEFGPLALEAVRESMISRGNSRGYINNNVNRIRRMFKWGVAKQFVPVQIYQALQAVDGLKRGKSQARETAPVLPVPDDVIAATLEFCSPVVGDMINLQKLTGCRPGEVRNIKPCEVDRSFAVWRYTPGSHKMEHKGRGRVIFIGPQAQAILSPYLLRDENEPCFEKPRGGMFKRWNYNEKINQACDKAFPAPAGTVGDELEAWRKSRRWAPNRLRHSAATLVRQKFGLEAAQTVLGHASADVSQIYAERDIAKAEDVMAKIG